MTNRRIIVALAIIVAIGAGFRLWDLGNAELTFDEGLYAFRSVGYLDYLESAAQPTPVQLFSGRALPWWTRLSFHDHPPFLFLVQRVSFMALGDSLFAARLPSALAGIAAIMLMFFIVRRLLQSDVAGLIAAALVSVSSAHVFISRLAMMESVLVALLLLNILAFLRFIEHPRRWIAFGTSFGLVLLTKYVGVVLLPVYIAVIAIQQPALFKHWRAYAAGALAILLFSPVIIYNIMLYKNFGHVDLQLSYLFGNMPAYWQGESGKTQEPFGNIIANLRALYSPLLLLIGLAGAVYAVAVRAARKTLALPVIAGASVTLLLIAVGSAPRFTALYVVPLIPLAASAFFIFLKQFPKPKLLAAALVIVIAAEASFMIKNEFENTPNYGIAQLARYFDDVFGDARPANLPRHQNPTLDSAIRTSAEEIPATLLPSGIIYDDNLSIGPMLWLFSRRQYYHGIPVMPASVFLEAQKSKNTAAFQYVALYFVKAGEGAPLKRARVTAAEEIEKALAAGGVKPAFAAIDGDGIRAFTVYAFKI